jgi:hypothetical protein
VLYPLTIALEGCGVAANWLTLATRTIGRSPAVADAVATAHAARQHDAVNARINRIREELQDR